MDIVLLGSSRLLYLAAQSIQEYYEGKRSITILDTDPSMVNKKFASVFHVITGSKQELFAFIREIQGETILLSVNNRYLIPPDIIQMPNLTLVNLHHALLPAHPGRNAEAWTIFEGDRQGGVTWHYIDAGTDTGQILLQASCEVTSRMCSLDLLKKCEELALSSLKELLPFEKIDKMPVRDQKVEGDRKVHKSTQVPGGGFLNPDWPAIKISCFLRAMDYGAKYPLGRAMISLSGKTYVIRRYKFIETEGNPAGKSFRCDLEKKEVVISEKDLTIELKLGKEG